MSEQETTENTNQEVEYTPVEQEALEAGWVPKAEFKGDEHKWVDAGEFLRRGELFKKIEDQSKELKDVRRALADMAKLHEQVREVEYKRALETLRRQRKEAMAEGDVDAVDLIEEKMDAVKEEQQNLKNNPAIKLPEETSGTQHPEFQAWLAQNSWYNTNEPMKAYADTLGTKLRAEGHSPSVVLKRVAEAVREEFPKRFTNVNRTKPGAVESGSTRTNRESNSDITLTDEERRIMNRFVRQGALTEAQYKESLKKVRG